MSLSALPIAFGVPPLSLLPVCAAGLLLGLRHRRAGAAVMAFGLAGLLLLALPAVSGLLTASLETGLPLTPSAADPPQAIVILSAGITRGLGPDPITPDTLTLERERAGAALARRTHLPILVTGGPTPEGVTLAAVMARSLAEDFGTPARWTEPAALDTWENATDSAALLKAEGIHSVFLVTHAWHMPRALAAFARAGIAATAAPVRLDPLPAFQASDFVPRTRDWLASYYALHEWIGRAAYAVLR